MSKIQSQAGTSLADTYDVQGSIAGVENLESKDVHLFDEMGARVQSERLQAFLILQTSTAILQSISWNVVAGGIPDSINRVLGASMWIGAASAGRVTSAMLSIQDQSLTREIPFLVWDDATDPEVNMRLNNDGGGAGSVLQLRPGGHTLLPQLLTRFGDENLMPVIRFRGTSSAFGAGTVEVRAVIHLLRPDPGDPAPGHPSSHGLPPPSW